MVAASVTLLTGQAQTQTGLRSCLITLKSGLEDRLQAH